VKHFHIAQALALHFIAQLAGGSKHPCFSVVDESRRHFHLLLDELF
jgi:hypothetical protein